MPTPTMVGVGGKERRDLHLLKKECTRVGMCSKKSKRVKPFSRDSHFNISTFLYLSTDSPRPGMEVISTTPSFTVMRT